MIRYVDFTNGEDKTWTGSITGATKASSCVLTINSHIFSVGESLTITGVSGMTQLNNNTYTITAITVNTVTINVDSTGFSTYTSGGTATAYAKAITNVTQANPAVVTSANHGFTNGQQIFINSVSGMTALNDGVFTVANTTTNTFELSGINSTGFGAYTSGGMVRRPYLTYAFTSSRVIAGDTLRIAKTAAYTTITISNSTWTNLSNTVTTVADHTGSISVGDYIGTSTAAGNGASESYYRVTAISASDITLEGYYGHTTKTVSSIRKIVPVSTGPVPGAAMTVAKNNLNISGGWTFGATPTRDSETWIRPTNARTVSTSRGIDITSSGVTLSYMNVLESYIGILPGTNAIVDSCTVKGYTISIYNIVAGATVSNCRICATTITTGSSCGMYTNTPLTLSGNIYFSTLASTAGIGFLVASYGATITATACVFNGCGVGIKLSVFCRLIDGVYNNSSNVAIYPTVDNTSIYNVNISNSLIYGIYMNNLQGILIQNSTIAQCVSGVYISGSKGIKIEGSSFANNTYDIDATSSSGAIYSINNSHLTPGTRAYNRGSTTGLIFITSCSIDAPSILKSFTQTLTDDYNAPQFYVQNSFGLTGAYYGRLEIAKNTSTIPPSVQMKFNTSTTTNFADFKIASTYTKAATAKTLNFKLTALSAGWSGTLVPKIKLNGITIATQSTISSISYGSDDSYSYAIGSGLLTDDGELSIEFQANCNTVTILVKEFTVT